MRYVTLASVAGTIFYNTVLNTSLLTLVALKLTTDLRVVGVLAALVQVAVVIQLPFIRTVETLGKKRLLVPSYVLVSAFTVPLILLPLLPEVGWLRLAVLMGSVGLMSLIRQPGLASWMPLLGDVVPDDIRGRFFGSMRTAWQSAGLVLALFTAWLIGQEAQWWQFQVIFAIGLVASLFRVGLVRRIPELAPHPTAAARGHVSFLAEVVRDRSFMTYVLLVGSIGFLLMIMGPFGVVYMRKALGYRDDFVMFSTQALPVAGAILTLVLWGHLADRIGNRAIFVLTTVGTALTTLVWLFVMPHSAAGQVALAASLFLRGLLQAGFGIASSRFLYGALPAGNKSGYTAVYTVVVGLTAGLGPLLGGFMLRHTEAFQGHLLGLSLDHYKLLFGLSGLATVVPLVLLARLGTAGDAPTAEFLSFLVSHPIRTTMDIMLYNRPLDEEHRVAVTRRLAASTSVVTLKELLDGLDDPSYRVREAAVRGLATRRQLGVVSALLRKLDEEDTLIRPALIWALGELRTARAVRPLARLLDAPDRHVRAHAAMALGKIGRHVALEPLLARWRAEQDLYVWACVITALSRLGNGAFIPDAVRRLTPDTPAVVRRQVASAIGGLLPLGLDFYDLLRSELRARGSAARRLVDRALPRRSRPSSQAPDADADARRKLIATVWHAYRHRQNEQVIHLAAPADQADRSASLAALVLRELAAAHPQTPQSSAASDEAALLALAAVCALITPAR